MYAIVEIAGQQFKVRKDQQLFVHRLSVEEGKDVSFDNVLLIDDDGKVEVGAPAIKGAEISAKVIRHLKGDKVIVFKKKRRKGYKKKNGHRQYLTEIKVEEIKTSTSLKSENKTEKKQSDVKKEVKPEALKSDDLTKIEGIGPKIASVLTDAGLSTFESLAKSTPESIKDILSNHSRLAGKNPSTWCKQAELAAAGKWEELKKWQDELDGGIA